ncbi:MAG: dTDP-4-dehydrorhamnose reductase [Tannerellaceae bacterium]|jgi:dTDP-4-dehydrorhamnose reductase|nr:dTDP-4-dehydrorhamnose reductase [Tannerellaceae bacterium]
MQDTQSRLTDVVAVTGAGGQLGQALKRLSATHPEFRFLFSDVADLDICSLDDVRRYAKANRVVTFINAAAYTAVDKAESEEPLALRINADGVRNLGIAMSECSGKVIHVSTDYVFDGFSSRPYVETDPCHPLSAYGRTKLAGEEALRIVDVPSAIVRTAWLYSENGSNFLRTMLRLGESRKELGVVFDQVGTPTFAEDLAAAILSMLNRPFVPGIYHFSNEGVCSWYDFARKIMELSGLPCRIHPIESKYYPTPAQRPSFTVFNKTKIKQTYNIGGLHWEERLREVISRINRQHSGL